MATLLTLWQSPASVQLHVFAMQLCPEFVRGLETHPNICSPFCTLTVDAKLLQLLLRDGSAEDWFKHPWIWLAAIFLVPEGILDLTCLSRYPRLYYNHAALLWGETHPMHMHQTRSMLAVMEMWTPGSGSYGEFLACPNISVFRAIRCHCSSCQMLTLLLEKSFKWGSRISDARLKFHESSDQAFLNVLCNLETVLCPVVCTRPTTMQISP